MSDREFAVVMAALLYNEQFGWFEEEVRPIRGLTPFYESLQVQANNAGANLSVWPANLRPSVAAEILQQRIPVPPPTDVITRPIVVAGSHVDPSEYASQSDLYAAITREIADPALAVEYLASNLERGLYRAAFERVPLTWRTLAVWHNQGIVDPHDVAENATAASYMRRTSAFLPAARRLVDEPVLCAPQGCSLAERLVQGGEWLVDLSFAPQPGTYPATADPSATHNQVKGRHHAGRAIDD